MPNVLSAFTSPELHQAYRSVIEQSYEISEYGRDIAYDESDSYRGFRVADVGCAILPGGEEIIKIARANFKHKHLPENDDYDAESDLEDSELFEAGIDRDIPKICAEAGTIIDLDTGKDYPELAAANGSLIIPREKIFFVAHFTIGTSNQKLIRDVTGMNTRTLTPCKDPCMPALDASHNTTSSTLYVSGGLDDRTTQVRTMRNLKNLYRDGTESGHDIPAFDLNPQAVKNALEYYDSEVLSRRYAGPKNARIYSSIARAAFRYAATVQ